MINVIRPFSAAVLLLCAAFSTSALAHNPMCECKAIDAELWITMEGWDGAMHQASIPLSQASPATLAWLNQQGGKP